MKSIEQRIEALERSNRWHRYVNITLALTVLVMVAVAGTPHDKPKKKSGMTVRELLEQPIPEYPQKKTDVIRAQRFEVVDPDGDPVVILDSTALGGRIALTNGQQEVIILQALLTAGVTTVHTPSGTVGIGTGWLINCSNKQGQQVFKIDSLENGGDVTVLNKTGEPVCTMTVDEYGNGEVGVWDRKGKGRVLRPGP